MILSVNEMVMVKAAMEIYSPRRQLLKDQKEAMLRKLNEEIKKAMENVVM